MMWSNYAITETCKNTIGGHPCPGRLFEDHTNGFLTCRQCGLVDQDAVVYASEANRWDESSGFADTVREEISPHSAFLSHGKDNISFVVSLRSI